MQLQQMRHVDRQVGDAVLLVQVARAYDVAWSESLRILADETVKRDVRSVVTALDLDWAYLDSVPHKEVYLLRAIINTPTQWNCHENQESTPLVCHENQRRTC